MDLRRLQHLLALDEQRHFARAAEQVHLSQPAFSRSIQALERELGSEHDLVIDVDDVAGGERVRVDFE